MGQTSKRLSLKEVVLGGRCMLFEDGVGWEEGG